MKSNKKKVILNGMNEIIINKFYNNITREQLNKSLFYWELFNHYVRNTILRNIQCKILTECSFKKLGSKSDKEDLLLSYRLINGYFYLIFSKKCIPHFKKRAKGGEDSHYVTDR
jgi:hypothetical protein